MPVPKPEWLEACRAEAEVRRKLPDLPIVLSSHARKRAKYRLRISPEEVEARIRASERTFRSDDTHWVVSLGLFEALLVFCPSYPPGELRVVTLVNAGPSALDGWDPRANHFDDRVAYENSPAKRFDERAALAKRPRR